MDGLLERQDPEITAIIDAIRAKFEAIRLSEVTKALGRCRDAPPDVAAALEAMSRAIVSTVLRGPTAKLRESEIDGRWAAAMSELFGLDGGVSQEKGAGVLTASREPERGRAKASVLAPAR